MTAKIYRYSGRLSVPFASSINYGACGVRLLISLRINGYSVVLDHKTRRLNSGERRNDCNA